MGVLTRRKKKGPEGFKDFVKNLELTPSDKLKEILRVSILDDPIYTKWAVRNIITISKFLDLSSDSMNKIIDILPNSYSILVKAFYDQEHLEQKLIDNMNEFHKRKYSEEKKYIEEFDPKVKEPATFSIIKCSRQLQEKGEVSELDWKLPEKDIIDVKKPKVDSGVWEIHHEDGSVSGRGPLINYERSGQWEHFYPTGELLASGEYMNDLKTGYWHFYKVDGSILAEGEYEQDKKVGKWIVND